MPIVVEDGTGKVDADAYVSVAAADTYFSTRNRLQWASLSPEEKEAAIVSATDFIESVYYNRFIGTKKVDVQALSWPRIGTGLADMPVQLTRATCEYALFAAQGPLMAAPVVDSTGQVLLKTVKEVGPIKKEITYQSGGRNYMNGPRPMPMPDTLMRSLLRSSGGVYR